MVIRLSVALVLLNAVAKSAYLDDKVSSLPDMGEFNSWALYSGYLDIQG